MWPILYCSCQAQGVRVISDGGGGEAERLLRLLFWGCRCFVWVSGSFRTYLSTVDWRRDCDVGLDPLERGGVGGRQKSWGVWLSLVHHSSGFHQGSSLQHSMIPHHVFFLCVCSHLNAMIGLGLSVSYVPLTPQHLEQCLVHSKCLYRYSEWTQERRKLEGRKSK